MTDEEEWRRLPGFDDSYNVSNIGRVRSYKPRNGRGANVTDPHLLRLDHKDKDGYIHITLRNEGKDVDVRVHTLVLMAFDVHPDPGQDQICHGNGVRDDNRLVNLRWGTAVDNAQDRIDHGHSTNNFKVYVGSDLAISKLTEDDVREIRRLRAIEFPSEIGFLRKRIWSYKNLGAKFGVSGADIGYIIRRKTWTHI